jgi:hypothetical protein
MKQKTFSRTVDNMLHKKMDVRRMRRLYRTAVEVNRRNQSFGAQESVEFARKTLNRIDHRMSKYVKKFNAALEREQAAKAAPDQMDIALKSVPAKPAVIEVASIEVPAEIKVRKTPARDAKGRFIKAAA